MPQKKQFRILRWLYLLQIIPTPPLFVLGGILMFVFLTAGDRKSVKIALYLAAVPIILFFLFLSLFVLEVLKDNPALGAGTAFFAMISAPMLVVNLLGYYFLYRGYKRLG